MKLLRFYIIHRLWFIFGLIAFGIASHIWMDTILAWICYIIAFFSIILYLLVGTMRLVQEAVMAGEVEEATRLLKMIRFPKLLFKPLRQAYYMIQSNVALATDNLDEAEQNLRASLNSQSSLAGDTRGASLAQLGFVQLRKGDVKEGRKLLLEAVKVGIPDANTLAATHLQLCSIEVQRQQFRIAKEHFKKAKAAKPKEPEILSQIQQLEKQIPRLPG